MAQRRTRLLATATALAAAAVACGSFAARALGAWPDDPIAVARNGCLAAAVAATTALVWLLHRRGRAVLRAMLRRPRLLRAGLGTAATLLVLLSVEGALRLRPTFGQSSDVLLRSAPFVENDAQLGYRLVRNAWIEVDLVRARDDAPLGHVRYGLDAHRRRRTVLPQADGHDRAVAFFGCSQTFGHGLDDADTLPSRYAAHMPRDLVVNLAVPGYGPNHAVLLAQDPDAMALPALPRPPIAVFVWIDHHLRRLCGSLRVRSFYGIDAPCFAIGPDGTAALQGPFRTAQPLRSVWCWAVAKSELLKLTGYDWPAEERPEDVDLAAAVLRSLADTWQREHGGRLLLVQYPTEHVGSRLAERLRDSGVAFADLDGMFDPYADGMSIDRDGHPTPRATELLGARIAEAVRRAFP
ncbi:MAG: hypothetical protein AB7O97_08810 [Planctomycetota bacterium]